MHLRHELVQHFFLDDAGLQYTGGFVEGGAGRDDALVDDSFVDGEHLEDVPLVDVSQTVSHFVRHLVDDDLATDLEHLDEDL